MHELDISMMKDMSKLIPFFLAAAGFLVYVSNVRPVGWFDSVVGLVIAGAILFYTKKWFKSKDKK